MSALTANGMVTQLGGILGTSEVHNEILHKCAETGIFGLASILSIYCVPALILLRSIKFSESRTRLSAFISLSLVLGFFIFGLTVEIFDLKMTATFFAFTLATLMAAATHHTLPRPAAILATTEAVTPRPVVASIQEIKPTKIKLIFHIVKTSILPLIAALALAIAFVANENNKMSTEQLTKAKNQIEILNKDILATQIEIKKLQTELAEEMSLQDASQKQKDERTTLIIQQVSALQKKMRIHPNIEENITNDH
jgi:hypothetical protein